MAQELVVMGEDKSISLWRKPEEVLLEAQQVAKALIQVVEMKKNKVIFNGETYLEFEDWQFVANFYGCTTKIESTSPVEFAGVFGFEASAVVLDRHQNVIGRVDSMCLSDEENWGDVPKYEWVDVLDAEGKKVWDPNAFKGKGGYKREKKEVGRTPKPLFQLRSMAQTRAQVKALRSKFSWVVVMAGYQPTPAEELTGNEFPPEDDAPPKKAPVDPPKAKVDLIDGAGMITKRGGVGKDGALWINIGDVLMAIPQEKSGGYQFNVGDSLTYKAIEKQGKERKFLVLQVVVEYKVADKPAEAKAADVKPEEKKPEATQDPVGELEEVRTGKMGRSREVRLYTLMTQNKNKTGLTRDIVHEILNGMEPPVAHLSDLDKGTADFWEQIMKGDVDWRQFVEEKKEGE